MLDLPNEHEPVFVDVSELDLYELLDLDDTVLAHSVRRIRDETTERHDVIARFQNYL